MGVGRPPASVPPTGPRPNPRTTPSGQTQRDQRPVPRGQGGGQNSRGERIGLPLRPAIRTAVQARWNRCHPGLAFAKFADTWAEKKDEQSGAVLTSFTVAGPQKKDFFERIAEIMRVQKAGEGARLFHQLLARRCRLFATLQQEDWLVKKIPLTTDWRLVSGLGIAHPFEAGFVFDHTYGVPYLPGSSVKGAARAWAEETGWDYGECLAVFGPDEHPPKWQDENKHPKRPFVPAQGHVVFFDAYPTKWPELEVDVLNPHYKDYYEKKTDTNREPIPPADWLSPEPTYFLTVKADTPWEFVVGVPPLASLPVPLVEKLVQVFGCSKPVIQETLLRKARQAVEGAATDLGLGGKTAVGYGYFR